MNARIWNKRYWIKETNPAKLKEFFTDLLRSSGFKILKYVPQKFKPIGFTAVWVLAESHLVIHTFPEEKKTYIELSSCNKQMFDSFLKGKDNLT